MLNLVWLIPALPLAGFVVLAIVGQRFSERVAAIVGAGSVAAALVITLLVAVAFLVSPPLDYAHTQELWTWMSVDGFEPQFALRLDALSLVMTLVVTVVGFLVLLYSTEYMDGDNGYARFFTYMDLFVASMLILVLADDLLFLFLGWEGVGLCSYLLIGFWYRNPGNVRAARKAFIVTRIGDTAFAVGLLLLFTKLGSLQIPVLLQSAVEHWPAGSAMAVAAAALLLAGALGKSSQLPLQTWLPDAMAGPTPVSALIHAATMVTAGVYLIARMHVLFALAPVVMWLVAVIGAATLLLSGFAALAQRDIKRVLAYSTISQIGYMFLALGVGAWSAAIFHFVTHAFFKSLLFLAAGVLIVGLKREHDMFRMGGLRKALPGTFWAFLIGAASLSALPLLTAGFYSKDLILFRAWSSSSGGPWLWLAGLVGALLTSLYAFRMVFLTFFGEKRQEPTRRPGVRMGIPLFVLAGLSIFAGFIELPGTLWNLPLFSSLLSRALPPMPAPPVSLGTQAILQAIAAGTSIVGICLAWLLFRRSRQRVESLLETRSGRALHRLLLAGWGFDWLYDRALVRPFVWLARASREDLVGSYSSVIAAISETAHYALTLTQTGKVRWYATGIAVGAIVYILLAVLS